MEAPRSQESASSAWETEVTTHCFVPVSKAVENPMELRPGSRLGRYELNRVLGCGGYSTVFLCHTEGSFGYKHPVALKVAKLSNQASSGLVQEAFLQSSLTHPAIVRISDLGRTRGYLYVAMEFMAGHTLKKWIREGERMPLSVVVDIGLQLCDALNYMHGTGDRTPANPVVHADIKPANMFLSRFGEAKVSDFGIAVPGLSMANPSRGVGTAAYMAPEQVFGKPLDGRTDLFSMAVSLYEMVTGERLFASQDLPLLLKQRMSEGARLKNFPFEKNCGKGGALFAQFLKRCLRLEPNHRFRTAGHAASALKQVRTHLQSGPLAREWVVQHRLR